MEEKYYIPEISEFFVGFEYEYKELPESKWIKHIIEHPYHITTAYDSYSFLRVKFLDVQDIQECGFDYQYSDLTAKDTKFFFRPWIGKRDSGKKITCYTLLWREDENKVVIQTNEGYSPLIIFNGNIKNKSEFKRLLTQLGIE